MSTVLNESKAMQCMRFDVMTIRLLGVNHRVEVTMGSSCAWFWLTVHKMIFVDIYHESQSLEVYSVDRLTATNIRPLRAHNWRLRA